MYNPAVARWNGVDALAEKYQAWSPFNYTLNNPIRFIDPDGKKVRPHGERAKTAIQNMVPPAISKSIVLDENGFIMKKPLRQAIRRAKRAGVDIGNNSQYLLKAVRDKRTIDVMLDDGFEHLNSNGELQPKFDFGPISRTSTFEIEYGSVKEGLAAKGISKEEFFVMLENKGLVNEEQITGWFGQTLYPLEQSEIDAGKIDGFSTTSNIQVVLDREATDRELAKTAAHEMFAHALFFMKGSRGKDHGHGNPRVSQRLEEVEEEARENYDRNQR